MTSVRAEIATGPVLQRVLPRLVGVLSTRASLPLDRLHDGLLIADALSSASQAVLGDDALLTLEASGERNVTLRLGPLPRDQAEAMLARTALPSAGPIVERLADVRVEEAPDRMASIVIVIAPTPPNGTDTRATGPLDR